MKCGIFDHVDYAGQALNQFYADRLKLTAAYDRLGFHCYHVAEHHFTPLGLAASPSVYLAAVAQHTRRILLGPCVYLLSIYHPLRILEEVCMLDNLSEGRLQLGVGRGVSPFEMGYYGLDNQTTTERYLEAYDVLMKGMQSDTLTHQGKHYSFDDVPLPLKPLQKPHPPLWYGMSTPDAAKFCAEAAMNTISIAPVDIIRKLTDLYRQTWAAAGRSPEALPLLGMSRHVVVAETDEEARSIGRRAYPQWRESLAWLWKRHNAPIKRLEEVYPLEWDDAEAAGVVIGGSPDRVLDYVISHSERAGVNYFVSWFCFGDMTLLEAKRSAELFAQDVMPRLPATRR
jgi:alkanesulfonate monooxygenase SsuD/methylene tetrahydromethanopterin reductase-like flavin-dependent oxidoreductase (luciferase family)